jgi:predicted RNase H-like HicB family nuclease
MGKMMGMKQRYHTIIKPEANGWFVGWVEEIPGTITQGRSLEECRRNLRDALELMVETHRDEARLGLDPSCIQEAIEIDVMEAPAEAAHGVMHAAMR